ncbi:MAG: adenylate/guanylate cyclase domain-containing protein, partial [Gemmobacter sp.]
FTALAGRTDPETLVTFLDRVYGAFDDALARHGLTKIKTSGDALLAVAGLPAPMPNHAGAAARCALDMIGAAAAMRDPDGRPVALRIGLASGAVVAGVVGKSRFFYDVWGDTVNLAARLQASGIAGQVHVAEAARAMLPDTVAPELRGTMELKGIGLVRTWLLAPPGA